MIAGKKIYKVNIIFIAMRVSRDRNRSGDPSIFLKHGIHILNCLWLILYMFKNLKAGALSPATFGVGAAEGFDHGLIEQPTGDRVPCVQMWKEEARGAAPDGGCSAGAPVVDTRPWVARASWRLAARSAPSTR